MADRQDTIETWSTWTDDLVMARHRCRENGHDDIGVLRRAAGDSGPEAWILAIMVIATDEDVKSGKAPRVGDPVWATAITVSFCPFCGVGLDE